MQGYLKVPFRKVYVAGGLRHWLATSLHCLVFLKIAPKDWRG